MSQARKPGRLRPQGKGLLDCLREFLTPAVWKQAQMARGSHRSSRWSTQPLVLVLLLMTWCCGDSQAERFETARAFCVVCRPNRRRPGKTVQGFQKALARLPMSVLRTLAAAVRHQLRATLDLLTDGFVVLGCDGSRLECPRSAELEQRLEPAGKDQAAPTIWVTAVVHLRTGLLWAWRLGRGTASERGHLLQLLRVLPKAALLVADAGYHGFPLAQALVAQQIAFLIRMSSAVRLYVDADTPLERYREGLVWYWPQKSERQGVVPLRLRLIRVRSRKKRGDVWLLTNVLKAQRLPAATAARYYRWRWENEGLFRTYKRTLAKVKLGSRTLRLIHREAEGSLLATQLLLAQGVRARSASCSPRKVLLAIRAAIVGRRGRRSFRQGLVAAGREQRPRSTPKVRRVWPRRKEHKPPKPPQLRTLSPRQKALIVRLLAQAA
ncbi:MAG: IS4 family transposase [Acidobacteria bacterium]|nr:IS4 family transposase [Acidobacteriota bacterium]